MRSRAAGGRGAARPRRPRRASPCSSGTPGAEPSGASRASSVRREPPEEVQWSRSASPSEPQTIDAPTAGRRPPSPRHGGRPLSCSSRSPSSSCVGLVGGRARRWSASGGLDERVERGRRAGSRPTASSVPAEHDGDDRAPAPATDAVPPTHRLDSGHHHRRPTPPRRRRPSSATTVDARCRRTGRAHDSCRASPRLAEHLAAPAGVAGPDRRAARRASPRRRVDRTRSRTLCAVAPLDGPLARRRALGARRRSASTTSSSPTRRPGVRRLPRQRRRPPRRRRRTSSSPPTPTGRESAAGDVRRRRGARSSSGSSTTATSAVCTRPDRADAEPATSRSTSSTPTRSAPAAIVTLPVADVDQDVETLSLRPRERARLVRLRPVEPRASESLGSSLPDQVEASASGPDDRCGSQCRLAMTEVDSRG